MDSVIQEPVIENGNILNLMKQSKIYWQAKKEIMNSILKNKSSLWQPSIQEILKTVIITENQQKLKGLITNCLQKSTRRLPIEKDSNPEIETYRAKWSDLICKEFNNISGKIFREEEYDQQDQSVSYTYDSSTLLQFMASIKIKSSIGVRDSPIFLFPNDIIKVSKYPQIRNKYSFLQAQQNVLGGYEDNDLKDRQKKAKKIADGQNISNEIQYYLCYGCVNGQRINVYRKYFQCFYQYNGKRVDYNLFEKVWKPIIKFDCKEILKQPTYFVFKEEMEKIFKLFICDKQISQMVKIRPLTPDPQLDKFAPIHHIIPCKSFSSYMAPFCYSSLSYEQIYQLFRQVYCNYLVHLNTISSLPDSILSLGILFEELLFSTQKKLVTKFQTLGIQPLRLVFPWIFYCFIGYVDVEQFYLILDRIIGTKSLDILPLYAMSIIFKYKTQVLQAKNQSEIIQILQDGLKEDIFVDTIREFFKYHL